MFICRVHIYNKGVFNIWSHPRSITSLNQSSQARLKIRDVEVYHMPLTSNKGNISVSMIIANNQGNQTEMSQSFHTKIIICNNLIILQYSFLFPFLVFWSLGGVAKFCNITQMRKALFKFSTSVSTVNGILHGIKIEGILLNFQYINIMHKKQSMWKASEYSFSMELFELNSCKSKISVTHLRRSKSPCKTRMC